jgi:4-hydroxybutyrate CoA-transferase
VREMDWKNEYRSKLVSPREAVKHIKSGDRVVIGHAAGEPSVLVDELVANYNEYRDVEIAHMVPMGKGEYTKLEMAGHFRHNSLFAGVSTRDAINCGRADYTPCFFYEVPKLFREGYLPVDVALIELSPPDEEGYCSFGISVDYTKSAAESANIVIAQINREMPRTFGDSFIHISDIDYIVEADRPILELNPPKITKVEESIGRYCASLIEDGSTLELGIGAIPDAILLFLKDKKDLGIHSEMISDGILNLYESGVITNKKKSIHKDKIIVTFMMGTKRLYDFVNNNKNVELYPVDYVNDPTVIMKNYKMISINSCIQVDLMGQVVSETIGERQFSGTGGQVDFVRGANMADGGKSIIAMPSTAANNKISRIVPFIDHGASVTTSRNDVNYIVTEYGIAQLKGKTLKERGRELINIAYPDFREELIKEWERRFRDRY